MEAKGSETTILDPAWAWARYEPSVERPWKLAWAGHLFRRAGFGATWAQLQDALAAGPHKTIDGLLHPGPDAAAFNRTHDDYEASAATGQSADGLAAWWLRRMVTSPHPLFERMTLFWHGYFGISNTHVENAELMLRHIRLLRGEALGSFGAMLQAIPHDPAVLLCLGSATNRKSAPQHGLARALMHNYTLGPGLFCDADVEGASLAFTGWFVLRGKVKYIELEHDERAKLILGQQGNFDAANVIDILLKHPGTSKTIVRALYRWFISETEEPTEELIAPLAESFTVDYDIAKLTETILRSNLFFSPAAYRQRVKSPVDYAVGMARSLEALIPTQQIHKDLAGLGQRLYHPPTVEGFVGGRYWINDASLAGRHNLADAMLHGAEPYGNKLNPWAVAQRHQCASASSAAKFLVDLFLQDDLGREQRAALLDAAHGVAAPGADREDVTLRRFTHSLATLAEFNLA